MLCRAVSSLVFILTLVLLFSLTLNGWFLIFHEVVDPFRRLGSGSTNGFETDLM